MTVLCPASLMRAAQFHAHTEHIGDGLDATYLVCRRDAELNTKMQEAIASILGEARRPEYCDGGRCAMIGSQRW